MWLLAVGVNHKTAPVEIRERVAFAPNTVQAALQDLNRVDGVREAAILSTCNRTELYCVAEPQAEASVVGWLGEHHALDHTGLEPHLYRHPGPAAVRHLLRVASGLDSMVLGEPQILGQVKTAYQDANSAGTLGSALEHLFQHTFSVAKQVRTDTSIGASAVSVAFAAVSLAKQIFGDLDQQRCLLIGAGETIELAARHLHQQGIQGMIVANRTLERAHHLATQFDGVAVTLDEIPSHLAEVEVVISSTASPQPILGLAEVRAAIKRRKRRPIFMVDIAVPRDIDPSVGKLDDIYLYTVDDLHDIITENLRSRQEAADQAEEIIETEVSRYQDWQRSLDAVDSIRELRQWADGVREEAIAKALRQLESGRSADDVVEQLARQLTNRMIHGPSQALRELGSQGRMDLVEVLSGTFGDNPVKRR
jgi:glutamyl-tRNA reductase